MPTSLARFLARLATPRLFLLAAGLLGLDLLIPDFVPFIDEILLGLGAALFGMWRGRVSVPRPAPATPAAEKPPMKNVTPGS